LKTDDVKLGILKTTDIYFKHHKKGYTTAPKWVTFPFHLEF